MFDLPESLVIKGTEYPINTDWRTWASVGVLLSEGKEAEDLGEALLMVFKTTKLPPLKDALSEILNFYRRGKKAAGGKKNEEPAFDLVYDFGLVSAAFLSKYRIDLRKSDLHWWEFWEKFEALPSDEKIIKVIGYRSCNLNEIKNKDEKKHVKKMKELYKLPSRRVKVTSEEMGFELDKLM